MFAWHWNRWRSCYRLKFELSLNLVKLYSCNSLHWPSNTMHETLHQIVIQVCMALESLTVMLLFEPDETKFQMAGLILIHSHLPAMATTMLNGTSCVKLIVIHTWQWNRWQSCETKLENDTANFTPDRHSNLEQWTIWINLPWGIRGYLNFRWPFIVKKWAIASPPSTVAPLKNQKTSHVNEWLTIYKIKNWKK